MKSLSTFRNKMIVCLQSKYFSYKIDKLPEYLRITDTKTSNFYDFHYFWLRHQCSCLPLCKHPKTLEKTLKPTEFPLSTQPLSVELSNDTNEIAVKWHNHMSTYNVEKLIENKYSKNQTHYAPPQTFSLEDVELDYQAFKDNKKKYLAEVKKRVDNYDLFVIRNYGLDTEAIINDFGKQVFESHFGRYEDLKTNNTTNKNTDQLGDTSSDVDLHTDLPFYSTPPTWQLLQCINPADKGGENF